jgi:hypothetical protein
MYVEVLWREGMDRIRLGDHKVPKQNLVKVIMKI